MLKRVIRILLFVAAVIIVGYFVLQKKDAGSFETVSAAVANQDEAVQMPVKTTAVKRGDFLLSFKAIGEVCAHQQTTMRFAVGGIVEQVLVREGDFVSQNDILLRLRSPELEISLQQTENRRLEAYSKYLSQFKMIQDQLNNPDENLLQAKKDYEQALQLFRLGKLNKAELEQKEALLLERFILQGALQDEVQKTVSGLSQAEMELKNARLNFEKLTLCAPFSGRISLLRVSAGERVNAEQEALRLVNTDKLFIKAYILESELAKIKPKAEVRLKFISQPEKVYKGVVRSFLPEIDIQQRMVTAIIDLSEKSDLLVGLKADIDIASEVMRNVLLVPREAILVRSGRPLIFIVENGIALWKYITIKAMGEEECWIEAEEVKPGDRVIIEGHLALAHQTAVQEEEQ